MFRSEKASMCLEDGEVVIRADRFVVPDQHEGKNMTKPEMPVFSIGVNRDAEGRPLIEIDGRSLGPADDLLTMLLDWKVVQATKMVRDQVDAFRDAFVRL